MRYEYHNESIELPGSWNEVHPDCVANICLHLLPSLHRFYMKGEPVSMNLLSQVQMAILLEISQKDRKEFLKISPGFIHYLIDTAKAVDFIIEKKERTKVIFPTIGKLIGPLSNFDDLTADEFFSASGFLEAYINEEDSNEKNKYLNLFFSCLYRTGKKMPFSKKILERELFEISTIEKHAEHYYLSRLPLKHKLAVKFWFECCTIQLREDFPEAFEGKRGGDGDFRELFLQIAKDGPFGNYAMVKQTKIKDVLAELCRISKEAVKMKLKQ